MREFAWTRRRWGTGLVVAFLLEGLASGPLRAMTVDEGRPLVRALAPQEYETAARIDALAVAPDGTLLAAAGSDVITYDGARFDRIATTIPRLRALAASGDGARIYVGGDDQLGVIERGTFRSLGES